MFTGAASLEEQARWFDENGPFVPGLIDHLRAHVPAYDRVLFWSYRYYPAFHGVQAVPERAVLVPTAEEDPLIHAPILSSYFARPRAFLFLTPEERDLVTARIAGAVPPSAVIGAGPRCAGSPPGREVLDAHRHPGDVPALHGPHRAEQGVRDAAAATSLRTSPTAARRSRW